MTTNRAEIPAKYKWDLSAIYPSEEAFWADFSATEELVKAFPAHADTMLKSADALAAMFRDYFAIERKINLLYEYAARNFDVDTTVNAYQSMTGKVMNLANDAGSATYFVTPYLLKLDTATVDKWLAENKELAEYRRAIETTLRFKPYTLSDECEKLLADLRAGMDASSQTRSIFANSDLRFGKIKGADGKPVELTSENFVTFEMDPDRRVRRAAFNKLYDTYRRFGNTFATMLDGFTREKSVLAKVSKYPSDLDATVFQDEVTSDIYNNLIATVGKNLGVLYEYYDLKREMLGVGQFHLYDSYTPLIKGYSREYTFEEAVDEVLDMAKVFGKEYHDTMEAGFREKGWIDVYPNRGKRGGAYSSGCYDTEPYILLNFNGKYDDVSTLAHEGGHSMHSYYSRTYNKPHECNYTIFVAEVASTVNELLLANKKLRESKDDKEKMSILNELMDTYKGTLFRQTMFAEFEKEFHALSEVGEPLTADLLNGKYYEIVKKYFGPRVVCDKGIACEWMRIPHFYYNFYVYKYATCISAASYIVKRIEAEGQPYVDKYISFLKCGGSRSPIDSLKLAEVDLTRPEVIEDAIATFGDILAQFRALRKKVGDA